MSVELPLCIAVTLSKNVVMFSGIKMSIRSFVLFIILIIYPIELVMNLKKTFLSSDIFLGRSLDNTGLTLAFLKDLVTLSS